MGDALNGLVGGPDHVVHELAERGVRPGSLARFPHPLDQVPHPPQPAHHAVDVAVVPRAALGPAVAEHQEGAHRVGAVAPHLLVGVDHVAARLAHAVAVAAQNVALVAQLQHRLGAGLQTQVPIRLVEEARVQQVHGGVLGAAGVGVDRHPVAVLGGIERSVGALRAEVAQVVPRRAHESVHGVGLALRRLRAARTGGVAPRGMELERALAGRAPLDVVRQLHRKLLLRHRHRAATPAVHHRNGAPPVALAGDQPVAQPVVDLGAADAALLQPGGGARDRLAGGGAGQRPGVDHRPVGDHRFRHRRAVERRGPGRLNDRAHRQAVGAGKGEVARVMGRHRHDGAGAVGHQHVVGDPDRDLLVVDRVDRIGAGEHAALLAARGLALDVGLAGGGGHVLLDLRAPVRRSELGDQRMLGREHHEGGAPQRVGAGGEHLQRVAPLGPERHVGAFAAPDPVGLQGTDALRPVDSVEAQQLLGVAGDAQEPLLQIALDHRRGATLAVAPLPHHLFARHGGVAVGAEVHRGMAAVGEAAGEQLEKEPLRPAVVLGIGGGGLALPIPHRAHAAKLAAHAVDVGVGPLLGVDVAADGRVLRGQRERVEADRVQHVVPLHAQIARAGVRRRHRIPVADVQVAGRIGQHGQEIVLGPLRVDARPVQTLILPPPLPLGLDGSRIIGRPPLADHSLSLHGCSYPTIPRRGHSAGQVEASPRTITTLPVRTISTTVNLRSILIRASIFSVAPVAITIIDSWVRSSVLQPKCWAICSASVR